MLNEWFAILQPAPAAAPLRDPMQIDRAYRDWRRRILYTSLIGYALFYFVRKNLSLAMPAMEKDLGITKSQLGIFLSLHGIVYGLSKFANGFLGDRTNARFFMALGLACSAAMNICFGLSSAVATLGVFWLLNGWFQGMGFPPCARSLTHWYSARERGTKFAVWNTSHSIGAALVLLLCSELVRYSWRLCFLVPAVLALAGVVFVIERLRDTPESVGLPPIEQYHHETGAGTAPAEMDGSAFRHFVLRNVLLNPGIWIISLANFFVYTVRSSIVDWGPTFLTEVKHVALHDAGWLVAGYEGAGVLGMLVSGWMTDRLFRGRASRACFLYMLLCGVCILCFWRLPAHSLIANAALLCAVGFLIYGPQCLVGVMAANLATKRAAATAIGVTGLFGYLSGVLSGWGLGRIVESGGWNPGFLTIVAAAATATLLFALAWITDRHHPRLPPPLSAIATEHPQENAAASPGSSFHQASS